MKKLVFASAILFSSLAIANTPAQEQPTAEKTQEQPPIAALRVFDTSGKEPKLIEGNALSRRKPRQLCLFVMNVPVQEKNRLVEYFKAPAPINMSMDGGVVQTTEDKKEHLITIEFTKEQLTSGTIAHCWTFTKTDPIGTYQVEAQFNDIVFKGLSFRILK